MGAGGIERLVSLPGVTFENVKHETFFMRFVDVQYLVVSLFGPAEEILLNTGKIG